MVQVRAWPSGGQEAMWALESRRPGFEFHVDCAPALWPWAAFVSSSVRWQSEFLPHRLAGINQEERVLSNYLAQAQPRVGASISMVLLSC